MAGGESGDTAQNSQRPEPATPRRTRSAPQQRGRQRLGSLPHLSMPISEYCEGLFASDARTRYDYINKQAEHEFDKFFEAIRNCLNIEVDPKLLQRAKEDLKVHIEYAGETWTRSTYIEELEDVNLNKFIDILEVVDSDMLEGQGNWKMASLWQSTMHSFCSSLLSKFSGPWLETLSM